MENLTKIRKYNITSKYNATYIKFNNQYINKYYFDDHYKKCENCGEYHQTDDMTDIGDRYEYKYICESCLDDDYSYCEICGEYYLNENMVRCDWCDEYVCENCIHTDNDNTTLCNGCWNNAYTCDDCGCYVHPDDIYYNEYDGNSYCESCYDNANHGAISNYSYKPDPEFYGNNSNNRFFGVELEVDKGNECEYTAQEIIDNNQEIYCKHDGSLNDGFEIVSHPCTLDYHLYQLDWQGIMEICKDNNFLSHDAVTCGLHVHISKKAFGNSPQEIELNTAKLIYLFEKFWSQIKTFSRRTEKQINDWAKNYGLNTINEAITEYKNKKGRYYAVNLTNTHTIEIRIFRGTLNYNTFAATLQFINLLLDTVMFGTIQDIQSLTWEEVVNGAKEYKELTEYLQIRKLA